jgi:hypothetical protein
MDPVMVEGCDAGPNQTNPHRRMQVRHDKCLTRLLDRSISFLCFKGYLTPIQV